MEQHGQVILVDAGQVAVEATKGEILWSCKSMAISRLSCTWSLPDSGFHANSDRLTRRFCGKKPPPFLTMDIPSQLILASASPRRRELLASLGFRFEVMPAEVVEHEDPDSEPREMVRRNAALKAIWVAARRPEALVLGADTTVYIDGQVLNKPRNLDEARAMLLRLS
jgi:hypothetical protein